MDTYMEYLVKKPMTSKDRAKRTIFLALIAFCVFGFIFMGGVPIIALACLVFGVVFLLINIFIIIPNTDVEYEYLYLDKEITVDKIMNKEKRKKMGVYPLEKLELMCPAGSPRGAYKNGSDQLKVIDYSSGVESTEHKPYDLFIEGNVKIVLDLPVDFVKMVQINAPRKVFMD